MFPKSSNAPTLFDPMFSDRQMHKALVQLDRGYGAIAQADGYQGLQFQIALGRPRLVIPADSDILVARVGPVEARFYSHASDNDSLVLYSEASPTDPLADLRAALAEQLGWDDKERWMRVSAPVYISVGMFSMEDRHDQITSGLDQS